MTELLLGCGLILAAGIGQLLLGRWARLADRLYAVLLAGGCALGLVPVLAVLSGGPDLQTRLSGSLPGGPWLFGLDALSAWFLLPVLGVGACAGVFGIGYLAAERAHRSIAAAHALFALLQVALIGVVTAQAMAPFLASWEVMAVSAYLLVMFEHHQAEVRRAGFIYIALTHVSTLALLAMFAALSVHSESRSFASLGAGNQLASSARTLALLFALVGFGLKAGAVPLHFWLPGAHAAAPSHVSAILSGVMLKMGIYGLLRVLLLLGAPPAWFGWALFGVGLGSGILGVLWALGERDLKRVLAYSSVENVGIILLGMGVGVLGLAYGHPALALLGFTGALLHALNHALFKSLLFLGAGAVVRATGTRVLDELGGLGRDMPWTALAFGVGAVAVVGLPPLNGFVSEWVAVQGLLEGVLQPGPLALLVLGLAGLGLIGALALACFSRAAGVVFLGQPRRPHPAVRDDWGLVGPMLVLAGSCAIIGAIPAVAVDPALAVAGLVVSAAGVAPGAVVVAVSGAAVGLSGLWGLLLGIALFAWAMRRRVTSNRLPAAGPTWGCAYARPMPRMQYTAGSFVTPLLAAFGQIAAPAIERTATSFRTHSDDRVLYRLVRPLWVRTRAIATAFRPLQQGPVTRYLQYVVVTVLLLLAALFLSIRLP